MKKVLFALFAMVAAVSCNKGKGSAYPPGYEVVLVNIEHRVNGYMFRMFISACRSRSIWQRSTPRARSSIVISSVATASAIGVATIIRFTAGCFQKA